MSVEIKPFGPKPYFRGPVTVEEVYEVFAILRVDSDEQDRARAIIEQMVESGGVVVTVEVIGERDPRASFNWVRIAIEARGFLTLCTYGRTPAVDLSRLYPPP